MEKCVFPKCRDISYLTYIGRAICAKHWFKLCELEGETHKKMLKKIKLSENKEGAIVPDSGKNN